MVAMADNRPGTYMDGDDYTYPPISTPTPAPDCRTADEKIAVRLAVLQAEIRLLIAEIISLREEVAALKRRQERSR